MNWRSVTPWLSASDIALLERDEASGNFTPDILMFLARDCASYRLWEARRN